MVLVDKEIRQRLKDDLPLIENVDNSLINCVSCDLTVKNVVNKKMNDNKYELLPGCVVFVETNESLNMHNDLLGIVTEKNSRMRQGLKVDAPRYHPGHSTHIFLRVQNISDKAITISKNSKIAQIMFEKLSDIPDIPYNNQNDSSYNQETEYIGFGKYENEYSGQIRDLDETIHQAKEDIDTASHRIYSNVLALMGIIVAVFSLITINYNSATQQDISLKFLVAMNLSLGFCIVLLMGLIFLFINTKKHKSLWIIYLIVLLLLAVAIVVFSLFAFN